MVIWRFFGICFQPDEEIIQFGWMEITRMQISPLRAEAQGRFYPAAFRWKNAALHLSRLCCFLKLVLCFVILSHLLGSEPTMNNGKTVVPLITISFLLNLENWSERSFHQSFCGQRLELSMCSECAFAEFTLIQMEVSWVMEVTPNHSFRMGQINGNHQIWSIKIQKLVVYS